MSNEAVEKRYASALFELAKEYGQLDEIEKEVRTVKEVFEENEPFQKLLKSPKLTIEKKQEILKNIFSGLSTFTLNLLLLLIERHRDELVTGVCHAFIERINDERGIADALVYSARPLSADESKAISEVFARKVGKQSLNIENIVDDSLLAGLKIRIGNSIFDSSLHGKLERLEKTLIS